MSQRRDPPNRVPPLQTLQVNPDHVLGQLAQVLTTSQTHELPEVRERAA
ncbi:hypothetical protein D187_004206 [Cystobacter fuscus DSM 2262]|uniref:Uncharacterized protein n=1 Tax=Cystobacter fuscus (strain ATCC 25194 / DSM 2262 / NBRC 100088 / M29) TaxID=1242864 RepID=S9QA32_CYSF2|nr:hypothetical protein [Cystobacter fuscus]EPX58169.1 hypothetical protein D187_004206 [Cystobacter fuscus DSM 2262]